MGQSDVEQRHLADAVAGLGGKRNAVGAAVRNQVTQPSHDQGIQGLLRLVMLDAVTNPAVDELAAQRGDHGEQHRIQQPMLGAAGVLGEVVAIGLQQVPLQGAALRRRGARGVLRHHAGHAADHGIPLVPAAGGIVRRGRQRFLRAPPRQPVAQRRLPVSREELGEAQRLHVPVANTSHRHAVREVGKAELQQRPGRDHRQLRLLLREPAQIRQHLGRRLHLVKEQHRLLRGGRYPQRQREIVEDAARVRLVEVAPQPRVALEVRLHQDAPRPRRPVPHQPGLAYLPGAADHQRAARPGMEPVVEEGREHPFHRLP